MDKPLQAVLPMFRLAMRGSASLGKSAGSAQAPLGKSIARAEQRTVTASCHRGGFSAAGSYIPGSPRRLPLSTAARQGPKGFGFSPFEAQPPSGARSFSKWTAASAASRLGPLLGRLALPVTAACVVAASGASGVAQHPHHPARLRDSLLPHHLQHASDCTASDDCTTAEAAPPPPRDVRSARALLAERGFAHPGMQPGAAWGAMPVQPEGSSKELHVMFEYLLLFPA